MNGWSDTMKDYFDQSAGLEWYDRPQRKEWLIGGFHVKYCFQSGGTGSSSDNFDGFEVYTGRLSEGGKYLFHIEVPFENLEKAIHETIRKLKTKHTAEAELAAKKAAIYEDLLKEDE